jgi:aminoglycoside phosphotransferase (APT) family kinase protein
LFRGYERVVERLLDLPVTIIHGEFYAPNILVHDSATELRVCPVDWEMAALGPGLIDLAALTAGTWSEQERATLALAYCAELAASGGALGPPEAMLAALDYCRLHLAVQWLGWSPSWSPPLKHAQNWLSEAVRLGEKLGLN